jgi:hypothetical protein
MNIDQLTYGELKQIATIFNATKSAKQEHPFVGMYCIARCYEAGVHSGEVVSVDGENVILKDSRRLWQWKAADGIALSGVAQNGIKKENCKFDTLNPLIYLTGVCELIPCNAKTKEQINEK